MAHFILYTLPHQYTPFKISYNTHKDKWSINELLIICVQDEERLIIEKGKRVNLTNYGKNKKNQEKIRARFLGKSWQKQHLPHSPSEIPPTTANLINYSYVSKPHQQLCLSTTLQPCLRNRTKPHQQLQRHQARRSDPWLPIKGEGDIEDKGKKNFGMKSLKKKDKEAG
ncbi:hypothetical protein CR513_33871, partial [Mucuna pruriens]